MSDADARRASIRLGVYTDYTYRRDANGAVYAERAFALFLASLVGRLEQLLIVGRLRPGEGTAAYALPPSIDFRALPFYSAQTDLSRSVFAMARSLRVYARALASIDVVWLFGPHPLALAFALLALARGKRVVLGVRQNYPEYVASRHPGQRWLRAAAGSLEAAYRLLARRCPAIVVGPELAANYRIAGELLEMNVSLVSERDLVRPEQALARSYDDEIRVLSVGRIEREKNPLLLARILAELARRRTRCRLVVCGEGPLEEQLAREFEREGVADRTEMLGYVPFDSLRDLYRGSHVFLHVSLTEGLPQVLFEAFAAGAPVVATAVGGVPAAAGDAAVLVGPDNAVAAADAVQRVIADPELRERLVRAGHERVRPRTLESESERVLAFLESRSG